MPKIGLLFPGQGSQSIGMGKELYHQLPSAKRLMDIANDILGFDIKSIVFAGSPDKLSLTEIAQPAIYIVSAMYMEKFKELREPFEIVAGHSLGEYSALYAAGVLSFEDGLQLVRKRGLAMSNTNAMGSMYAVIGLTLEEVEPYLEKYEQKVVVANINTKNQIVISGYVKEAAQAAEELAELDNVQVKQLKVSSAFHSPLMSEAQTIMAEEIDKVNFMVPKCFITPNISAIPTKDVQIIRESLKKQITGKVNWVDTILGMKTLGIERLYEIGHGDILRKMNKGITLRPKCIGI
ncbi:MAG: ACP S-malonyltransferase [Bacillota bacterium]|jgi:[acyl-carrier-protein] S-malonyltransferase